MKNSPGPPLKTLFQRSQLGTMIGGRLQERMIFADYSVEAPEKSGGMNHEKENQPV
jgi:hypothetical protein